MPVIRVSDDTWGRIRNWAMPLGGSVDDAVRRVLDVAEKQALPAPPRAWLERHLRISLQEEGGMSQRRARAQARRMTRTILDNWEKEVGGMTNTDLR